MPRTSSSRRGSKSDFADRIDRLGKKWKAAQKEADEITGGGGVPDGRYFSRITGMQVRETNDGKGIGLSTEFTVVRGDEMGNKAFRWDSLDREEGLPYLCKYLQTLGHDLDEFSLESLEEVIREILEDRPAVVIRVVTRQYKKQDGTEGEAQNIYVNKVVDIDDDVDTQDDEPEDKPKRGRGRPKKEETENDDGDDTPEIEKGSIVVVEHDGREKEGEVVSVNANKKTCSVELPRLKEPVTFKLADVDLVGDDEPDDKDDDGNDSAETRIPKKGDAVVVQYEKREKEGTIISVDSKKETVMVEVPRVDDPVKYKWTDIELLVDA